MGHKGGGREAGFALGGQFARCADGGLGAVAINTTPPTAVSGALA